MGVNPCAVDTVCCHMVHVNPADLVHLRLASQRGLGPDRLEEIQVLGDFPLEEVREKTKGFRFCMERIDDYFGAESHLSCTVGAFPEEHSPDYCWGGCPGALQEAMHIFRKYLPGVDREMRKIRYVVGKVEGPLELAEGERVIFSGDCTAWQGTIDGEKVAVRSSYIRNCERDVRKTKSNDLLLKTLGALWRCLIHRPSRHIHVKGCPVSVAEHVTYVSSIGKIGDPNFDPKLALPVSIAYWQMRINRLWNRMVGWAFPAARA